MIIALYRPNKIQLLYARFLNIFGIKVIEWEGNDSKHFDSLIKFPKSNEYAKLNNESRKILDNFFTDHFNYSAHTESNLYFRKVYDIKFFDYYTFRKQAEKKYKFKGNLHFLGGDYSKYVFGDIRPSLEKFVKFPFNFFVPYIVVFLYALKSYLLCFFYGGNSSVNSVMYIRKKAFPDLGLKHKLSESLNYRKISNFNSTMYYSKSKQKYGFSFLNDLENSKTRTIKSFFSVLMQVHSIILLQTINLIPNKDISAYVKDIFLAKNIINTNSKIYVGVLLDKPIYNLLYQFKKKNQIIMGFNESFFYPPFRSFDYNLLDVYFAMNSIDSSLQNKFGGEIKEIVNVEFFRILLLTISDVISEGLKLKIKEFDKVIIGTSIQVSTDDYTQWGICELNNFVNGLLKLADKNPTDLIVLKGKKNELSFLDQSIINRFDEYENFYVINSKQTRLLKYNQFEDLLDEADYLVSMSHTSTTLWQSIAKNIPVIAINDVHAKTFLSNYSFLEIKSDRMCDALTYWKELKNQELQSFFEDIKQRVNIGNSDGISQIADQILIAINNQD